MRRLKNFGTGSAVTAIALGTGLIIYDTIKNKGPLQLSYDFYREKFIENLESTGTVIQKFQSTIQLNLTIGCNRRVKFNIVQKSKVASYKKTNSYGAAKLSFQKGKGDLESFEKAIREANEKFIVLRIPGNAGASNRLMAIESAYAAARQSNRKVLIFWPLDRDVRFMFEDLFSHPDIRFINSDELDLISKNFNGETTTNAKEDFFQHVHDSSDLLDSRIFSEDKFIGLQSFGRFYSKKETESDINYEAQFFIPAKDPKKEADLYIDANFPKDGNIVGIHYRAWDKGGSGDDGIWELEVTPIDLFISEAKKVIQKNESVKFYLATDKSDIIAKFREELGNDRVLNLKGPQGRESLEAQRHGIKEQYILGNTRYIIGTNGSTFSAEAAVRTKEGFRIKLGPNPFAL